METKILKTTNINARFNVPISVLLLGVEMEVKVSLSCQGKQEKDKLTNKCTFCSSLSEAFSEYYCFFPAVLYCSILQLSPTPDLLTNGLRMSSVYS